MPARLIDILAAILRSVIARFIALSHGSWISLSAKLHIHSGGSMVFGRGVRVLNGSVLSVLPGAVVELKDGCILNRGVFVYSANRIEIGKRSRIAHYCSLIDHDYDIRSSDASFELPKVSKPIVIGDDVWVGANVVILKGVTIGSRCVIGAQTLVAKSVPEGMLAYCPSNSNLVVKEIKCDSLI